VELDGLLREKVAATANQFPPVTTSKKAVRKEKTPGEKNFRDSYQRRKDSAGGVWKVGLAPADLRVQKNLCPAANLL
jgi:hypothetical protein